MKALEQEAAEEARKHPNGQKEAGPAANPLPPGIDATARNDEVNVGVMQQVLPPGMQDAEEADFGSQVLGIAGDGEQRLRCSAEENAINRFLIVEREAGNLLGKREDDMEVFDRQQFCPPALQPSCPLRVLALGTVAVAAGVVGNARV